LTWDDSSDDGDDDDDVDIHCYERICRIATSCKVGVVSHQGNVFPLIFLDGGVKGVHGQNLEDVDGMLDEFIANFL
jgi:hypothetical protein